MGAPSSFPNVLGPKPPRLADGGRAGQADNETGAGDVSLSLLSGPPPAPENTREVAGPPGDVVAGTSATKTSDNGVVLEELRLVRGKVEACEGRLEKMEKELSRKLDLLLKNQELERIVREEELKEVAVSVPSSASTQTGKLLLPQRGSSMAGSARATGGSLKTIFFPGSPAACCRPDPPQVSGASAAEVEA